MNHDELIARLNYDAPCNGDKDRYEAARALRDLVRERDELQARLDTLQDFAETVAQGKRGDCTCWVCELAKQAQDALDTARGEPT